MVGEARLNSEVSFGSLADKVTSPRHVRFTPYAEGIWEDQHAL
jgi:hypothetical protein